MADEIGWNLESISETFSERARSLRERASSFRRLAGPILDGPFRGNLLQLAMDYERRAWALERMAEHRHRAAKRSYQSSPGQFQ